MTETKEQLRAISELINKARIYNPNLGIYIKHYVNEDFDYTVELSNNYVVKISRILAKDYSVMPSILTDLDLKEIANSARKF